MCSPTNYSSCFQTNKHICIMAVCLLFLATNRDTWLCQVFSRNSPISKLLITWNTHYIISGLSLLPAGPDPLPTAVDAGIANRLVQSWIGGTPPRFGTQLSRSQYMWTRLGLSTRQSSGKIINRILGPAPKSHQLFSNTIPQKPTLSQQPQDH